jgi:NADPH-dependent 2,4-dienoyl-CoA reductase/sulfur reductase-like enzyme
VQEHKYIIVGGGMTADSAVRGIREHDSEGSIALIGRERYPPYDRPPLTKGLWKDTEFEQIWRETDSLDVELFLGREATDLDLREKKIIMDDGTAIKFDRLLLATGGSPRTLPFGEDEIVYYRSVTDYEHIRERARAGDEIAVIGGGFIGSELSAGLAMNNHPVHMIFPEVGIGGLRFPEELSVHLNQKFRDRGVSVYAGELVEDLDAVNGRPSLVSKSGRKVPADTIVAGIGIEPNAELARAADLAVDEGIVVDHRLQTSHPDVFAAGDVASFYSSALDQRIRVEHEDNANTMGEMAGRSMAGEEVSYDYLPLFYSDLFDDGYEAVGILDSELETIIDWQAPLKKGVIYYLQEGRVRGVLLWNVWDRVPQARELIAAAGPFEPSDLRGRIS